MLISFRGGGVPAVLPSSFTRVTRPLSVGSGAMFLYSSGTSYISEPKGRSLALPAGFVPFSVFYFITGSVAVLLILWSLDCPSVVLRAWCGGALMVRRVFCILLGFCKVPPRCVQRSFYLGRLWFRQCGSLGFFHLYPFCGLRSTLYLLLVGGGRCCFLLRREKLRLDLGGRRELGQRR